MNSQVKFGETKHAIIQYKCIVGLSSNPYLRNRMYTVYCDCHPTAERGGESSLHFWLRLLMTVVFVSFVCPLLFALLPTADTSLDSQPSGILSGESSVTVNPQLRTAQRSETSRAWVPMEIASVGLTVKLGPRLALLIAKFLHGWPTWQSNPFDYC